MIIEFYGLPASGKTTDAEALLEKYDNSVELISYTRSLKKIKKLPYIFTPEFLSFFFKVVTLFMKKKNKIRFDFRVFYTFCCIYIRYMYLRKDKTYDYYIIDHGIIQNIVSALWNESSLAVCGEKLISHMGKHFSDDILLIYTVNSDNENIYSRIANREKEIRIKKYSVEEAKKILEIQAEVFEKLTAEADRHFNILKINSLDSFESCFEKICGCIEKVN